MSATNIGPELPNFQDPGPVLMLHGARFEHLPSKMLSDAFCIFSLAASVLSESNTRRYNSAGDRFTAEITPLAAPPQPQDERIRAYFYTGDARFEQDCGLSVTVKRMLLQPSAPLGVTELVTTLGFETELDTPDYAKWVAMHFTFCTPEGQPDPVGASAVMGTLADSTAQESAALSHSLDQIALSSAARGKT